MSKIINSSFNRCKIIRELQIDVDKLLKRKRERGKNYEKRISRAEFAFR